MDVLRRLLPSPPSGKSPDRAKVAGGEPEPMHTRFSSRPPASSGGATFCSGAAAFCRDCPSVHRTLGVPVSSGPVRFAKNGALLPGGGPCLATSRLIGSALALSHWRFDRASGKRWPFGRAAWASPPAGQDEREAAGVLSPWSGLGPGRVPVMGRPGTHPPEGTMPTMQVRSTVGRG
jgi:hypothetical protein